MAALLTTHTHLVMYKDHSIYGGKGWYIAGLCVAVWCIVAAMALDLYKGDHPDLYGRDPQPRVEKTKPHTGDITEKDKPVLKARAV